MDFTYYTDAPVRLATGLVNTSNQVTGEDALTDPAALERLLAEYGELVTGPVTERELDRVRAHRDLLRQVFTAGDAREAAGKLNLLLETTHAAPRLSVHGDAEPHLHFESLRAGLADRVGAICGMALAIVLCDHGKARFGVCASTSCLEVYIDMSKNCCKRYCSEGCAHRASVAAFRARKRQGATAGKRGTGKTA